MLLENLCLILGINKRNKKVYWKIVFWESFCTFLMWHCTTILFCPRQNSAEATIDVPEQLSQLMCHPRNRKIRQCHYTTERLVQTNLIRLYLSWELLMLNSNSRSSYGLLDPRKIYYLLLMSLNKDETSAQQYQWRRT